MGIKGRKGNVIFKVQASSAEKEPGLPLPGLDRLGGLVTFMGGVCGGGHRNEGKIWETYLD